MNGVDRRYISTETFLSRGAAKNTFYLKKVMTMVTLMWMRKVTLATQVGVTHVLNTAEGQQSGTVDTNEKFYK